MVKLATGPFLFCLDASAITHGANVPGSASVTAPSVVDEFQPGGATRRRLDMLLAAGLHVEAPTEASRARVAAAAMESGAAGRLSAADRDALALCLDHAGARLLTDDYTMLDVARRLGVLAQSVATRGIQKGRDWAARCAGCGREYAAEQAGKPCPVCGAEVRLRVRGRTRQ